MAVTVWTTDKVRYADILVLRNEVEVSVATIKTPSNQYDLKFKYREGSSWQSDGDAVTVASLTNYKDPISIREEADGTLRIAYLNILIWTSRNGGRTWQV